MTGPLSTARPLRPSKVATSDTVLPWLIVAVGVLAGAAVTAVWAAGNLAGRLDTNQWPGVGWSPTLLGAVAGVGNWPWPGTTLRTVLLGAAALLAAVAIPAGIVVLNTTAKAPRSDSMYRALGRPGHVTQLHLPAQQVTATRLRPATLAGTRPTKLPPAQVGMALGHVDTGTGTGPAVFAGWEDVMLAVMAPRTGKTTALTIPAICSAPGAVIATSNKLDILYTAAHRAHDHRPGPVDLRPAGRGPHPPNLVVGPAGRDHHRRGSRTPGRALHHHRGR